MYTFSKNSRMHSFQLIEVEYFNSHANGKEKKCLMMFSLWIAWRIPDSTERVWQSSFCYKEILIFQDLPDDNVNDAILTYSDCSPFHQKTEVLKNFLDIHFSIILWARYKCFWALVIPSHFWNIDRSLWNNVVTASNFLC